MAARSVESLEHAAIQTPANQKRRRVNCYATGKKLQLDVFMRNSGEADRIKKKFGKIPGETAKRRASDALLRTLLEIGEIEVPKRNKRGYIQTKIPKQLRERFRRALGAKADRGGADTIWRQLDRLIDRGSGKRLRNSSGMRKRIRNWSEFVTSGRALILAAKRDTGPDGLVSYSFDAGSSKKAVEQICGHWGLNFSEFFAALIARTCSELESAQTSHEPKAASETQSSSTPQHLRT